MAKSYAWTARDDAAEAVEAFHKLRRAASGRGDNSSFCAALRPNKLPPTLSFLPVRCRLCRVELWAIQEARRHDQTKHAKRKPGEENKCILCGKVFVSDVVRELHTLCWKQGFAGDGEEDRRVDDVRYLDGGDDGRGVECKGCEAEFDDETEFSAHWCRDERGGAGGGRKCPLGCGRQRPARGTTDAEMVLHLSAMHGCRQGHELVPREAGTGIFVLRTKNFLPCPRCKALVNPAAIPMSSHLIFLCPERGPNVTESVRTLKDVCRGSALDAEQLVFLELESFVEGADATDICQDVRENLPALLMAWQAAMDEDMGNHSLSCESAERAQRQVRKILRNKSKSLEADTGDERLGAAKHSKSEKRPPKGILKDLEDELDFQVDTDDYEDLLAEGFKVKKESLFRGYRKYED